MAVGALAVLPGVAPERTREYKDERRRGERREAAAGLEQCAPQVAPTERSQPVIVCAVVVKARREVAALRGREIDLHVVERAGAGRRSEAIALAGWTKAPAEHAVRVAAEAREVVRQREALERAVDLVWERLVRPVEAVRTLGEARRRVFRLFVVVAKSESHLLAAPHSELESRATPFHAATGGPGASRPEPCRTGLWAPAS